MVDDPAGRHAPDPSTPGRGKGGAPPQRPGDLPASIRLADYPELRRLAWNMQGVERLSPVDALNLYERNWRHVDESGLQPQERALLQSLADALSGGRLLV
jgi:hypothetical protein